MMGNPPTKPTLWQRMRCRGWAYHTWIDANGDDLTDVCAICGIGVYSNLPNPVFQGNKHDGKQYRQ
jgi:hypothetical protein